MRFLNVQRIIPVSKYMRSIQHISFDTQHKQPLNDERRIVLAACVALIQ